MGKLMVSLAAFGLSVGLNAHSYAMQSNQIIVKYKANHPSLVFVKQTLSNIADVKEMKSMAGGAYVVKLNPQGFKKTSLDELLTKLRQDKNVEYAVEDRIGHFKPLPKTKQTRFDLTLSHELQWDEYQRPQGVMLESSPWAKDGAWAYTQGKTNGAPIVVAVLDTGIEPNSNLVENVVKDNNGNMFGWNFAGNNRDISDETLSYHGTHVAGTIAGYGETMIGMGEYLKILPVKIPDASGMFYESQVINGIYWSVGGDVPGAPKNPYPAKVLNMSFGVDEKPGKELDYCDQALQEALWYARNKGAVVAVAAGNDNRWEHYNAPAVCNGTIKITSTGPKGLRSYFSNYGPGATFAAPGGDLRYGTAGGILSTVKSGEGYQGSGFAFYQGTSMASPHAAGLAALIYAAGEHLNLTALKVEQIMYTTTHDFGKSDDPNESCVGSKPCGHGIIDAENAVKATVAGFNHYLTGPKVSSALCKAGKLMPSIATKAGDWQLVSKLKSCDGATLTEFAHLNQEKGVIYAHLGDARYRLTTKFKGCQIIGVDGIGCY
jgi:serine protease